jgi:DNA-binding CsgD family transcriptional regulator
MTRQYPQIPVAELTELVRSGASLTAAARGYGMPWPRLREQIVSAELTVPAPGVRAGSTRYPDLTGPYLRAQYARARRPAVRIAEDVGCSDAVVRVALGRHGISRRGRGRRMAPKALTKAYLRRWYVDGGKTMTEIAEKLGTTVDTVGAHLDRYGFTRRKEPLAHLRKEVDEAAFQRLFDAGVSYRRMAAELGASVGLLHKRAGELAWTR